LHYSDKEPSVPAISATTTIVVAMNIMVAVMNTKADPFTLKSVCIAVVIIMG
jgi:hypothetical protein